MLAALLPELLPELWVFALRVAHDAGTAEELTRRTCLRACAEERRRPRGSTPLCWLYTVAYRIWRDELRASNPGRRSDVASEVVTHARPGQADEADAALAEATPADADAVQAGGDVRDGTFDECIVAAVARLPETQRIAMLLVAVDGFSYAQAADVLDVSVNAVMSDVSRARQALARELGNMQRDGAVRRDGGAADEVDAAP
jgi:RNA polymerase sigma-70 factor (ECF subfamily)